jgi:hypothetical protein
MWPWIDDLAAAAAATGAIPWAWLQAADVPPAVPGERGTRVIGFQELQPKWKEILPEAVAKLEAMGAKVRLMD